MAAAAFYDKLDDLKTLLGDLSPFIFANQRITLNEMAQYNGCCQDGNVNCCGVGIFASNLISNGVPPSTTFQQLISTRTYFSFITNAMDTVNTYSNSQNEPKNGFLTDLNPTNTADYTNTPLEMDEQTNYFRFVNVYESGINFPPTSSDINFYTNADIGTRIIPLMQLTPANFYKIENIEIVFKFFSVEGGTPFVPPALQLWLVKDNNDGSALSQVGTAVKSFDTTSPITVGGLKEYRYKFVIPQAFYNLVTVNKTFPTDGVGSITDWSTFVNTISGNITNSDEVYYFALMTPTPAASGKGWFQCAFTAKMSGADECQGPCRIDCTSGKPECLKCPDTACIGYSDSTYWTVA